MRRKIFLCAIVLLIQAITSTNAASLKHLSEKLSANVNAADREKIEDPALNDVMKHGFREDEDVAELDKLKGHKGINKEVINLSEQLEDSLKMLHDSNTHHKPNEGSINTKTFEEVTESSTPLQKEILENLQLDGGEVPASNAKNEQRRSSMKNEMSLTANMLRHLNGKYSAYDMAQYIFWTGDEEGVANAVEELIDEGLMSRENAIEFLSDIRLGIDYLENMYSLKQNESRNTLPFSRFTLPIKPTTTSTQDPVIEDIPFSYNYNYQKFHSFFKPSNKEKINIEEDETRTLSPAALKALEKIPSLMKLTELHSKENKQESLDVEGDVDAGRSRLADYVFGEYSLEEVIYQLAKTMFTQSLTHGSEESQAALQKLTQFLENEGKHGRISPILQKKILDVLLAALSDTLSENPEIMEKARRALKIK